MGWTVTPRVVRGLGSGTRSIAAGGNTTCALTNSGEVKCWGDNASGTVGAGLLAEETASNPVGVIDLTPGVRFLSQFNDRHVCAFLTNNTAKCWGEGDRGQIGNGGVGGVWSPIQVNTGYFP